MDSLCFQLSIFFIIHTELISVSCDSLKALRNICKVVWFVKSNNWISTMCQIYSNNPPFTWPSLTNVWWMKTYQGLTLVATVNYSISARPADIFKFFLVTESFILYSFFRRHWKRLQAAFQKGFLIDIFVGSGLKVSPKAHFKGSL